MRSGTYIALREAVEIGGADLYCIKLGMVDAPIVAARAYSAPALLGAGGGGSTDEEEGQEGNQEPCSRGCMHGESDL